MESVKTSLAIGCVILAMTLFDGRMTSHAYDDDVTSDDDYVSVPSAEVGKRSTSSLCRRCRFHRDDWVSCGLCYGRPRGIVPYYGKRSFGDWQDAEEDDPAGVDGGRSNQGRVDDAAVLYARCCDALGIQGCCRRRSKRGYYTVYFPDDGGDYLGSERYETMKKRGYETSFLPIEEDAGVRCSCCEGPMYDYSCCSASCSERK